MTDITDTIEKRLTLEEFTSRLAAAFHPAPETVTIDTDFLIEVLSRALFDLQEETETRVRREMVKPSLN